MSTSMKNVAKSRALSSKIEHDLNDLTELAELSEQLLQKQLKSLSRRISREARDLKGYEREYQIGWYIPDVIQLKDIFPKIQRYSLFATIMTTVESNLVALCRYVEVEGPAASKFKKGGPTDVVNQTLDYLIANAKIDAKRLVHDRSNVVMFWRIRNCIIHSEGKITGKFSEEIVKFCKEIPTLDVDKHNYIVMHEGFLGIALHVIKGLFRDLLRYINFFVRSQTDKALSIQGAE